MSTTEPTSLHAYFAANAPADPPEWFKPDMAHLPLPVPLEKVDTGAFGQPGPEYAAWLKAKEAAEERRAEYRYFAWRWYYAEQMVKSNPSTPFAGAF